VQEICGNLLFTRVEHAHVFECVAVPSVHACMYDYYTTACRPNDESSASYITSLVLIHTAESPLLSAVLYVG